MKIVYFLCAMSMAFIMLGTGAYQMAAAPTTSHKNAFWAAGFFILCGVFLGIGITLLVLL